MTEEEIKQTIKECKIVDLYDLAIMMHTQDVAQHDMIAVFKKQQKEVLEKQVLSWEDLMHQLTLQHHVSGLLTEKLDEDNQNELIEGMMTLKECKFMNYKLSLQMDYHKVCIELMKKMIKNK